MKGAGYSRVTHPFATLTRTEVLDPVRLACVKHAASVRPEPGSNSPKKLTCGRSYSLNHSENESQQHRHHGVMSSATKKKTNHIVIPKNRDAIKWHQKQNTLLRCQTTSTHRELPDLSVRPWGNFSSLHTHCLAVKSTCFSVCVLVEFRSCSGRFRFRRFPIGLDDLMQGPHRRSNRSGVTHATSPLFVAKSMKTSSWMASEEIATLRLRSTRLARP